MKVNECPPSSAQVASGCLQSPIFGPLMYIIYTDSLKYIIPENVHVKIRADDVKMYTAVDDINNVIISRTP